MRLSARNRLQINVVSAFSNGCCDVTKLRNTATDAGVLRGDVGVKGVVRRVKVTLKVGRTFGARV